ncbi:hypothetical protein V9K67_04540 [Paraflavisolibacter sp. H34]|uniref:hypothetical protein n=1 Tax=Huijunlia imazamoxiresistens TaxID=3127457 RepID=UPI003016FEB2
MTKTLLAVCCLLAFFFCPAQPAEGYRPLDPKQPITFLGDRIVFKGDTVALGPKAFFIDGGLPDSVVARYRFVYNSVIEAAAHLTHGTEAAPMTLYLAPWVYWIDNPDDPAVRVPKEGSTPYGLEIACEWLHFRGLTDDARNVVLAANRGQTIGAQGNYTLFKFTGQGTGSENLTFGNYCNVDLVYPLKPALGRPRRASAIVQAQLIHCNGDKIVARNTRFISRLNLCPFTGGKRVLFDRCHFESTDDALCGTGVYLHSTLDIYGSKPFYHTTGTGAVFLDCALRSFAGDRQYFTKAGGQVALIDCRLTSPAHTYWGWQEVVPPETRNYQAGVTLNGKPLFIGRNDPASTIDLAGKPLLLAYRFVHQGKVVYNTYNLLRGDDDWDPMGIKPLVLQAEKKAHTRYTGLPVQLKLAPTGRSLETRKNEALLQPTLQRFGNYAVHQEKLTWSVAPADKAFVQLKLSPDGGSCTVIPTNQRDTPRQVVVRAVTASGLEGASLLRVSPAILEAPRFSASPYVATSGPGSYRVAYRLDTKYADRSDIRWYRCRDERGTQPVEVAVSRFDSPLRNYVLSVGDIGWHLMAEVTPRHIRSKAGEPYRFILSQPVTARQVTADARVLATDFKNLSTKNQSLVLPGFWTLGYPENGPEDPRNRPDKARDAWQYGEGSEGAAGFWGLLQGRTASLAYIPVDGQQGDMSLTLTLAPFKTAGQGFSVAHLYMDVLVKMDTKTRSGYALRLIRTTKYHDAVDAVLLRYENGKAMAIGEPVTTTAFRTPCTIKVSMKGDKLSAHVSTGAPASERPGVAATVALEQTVEPTAFGGFGIEYNGGSPTLIKDLKVEWKGN